MTPESTWDEPGEEWEEYAEEYSYGSRKKR
jgi:hypothetical protein